MKSFWLGVAGSCVGMALFVAVGLVFAQDIFQVEKDGTPRFKVTADGKIPVGSTGSYENLVIQNNATEPNNKVDITADAITVEAVRLESLNVSATITTSGAGGLDAGSEAGSTWYYVWAITNNDGTSSNGLLSASSTSPTLPSGYTKKRRVGAVRNNASSNFLQFVQEGNRCQYLAGYGSGNNRILSGGVTTTFTTVSAATYLPETSRTGLFLIMCSLDHNTANNGFSVYVRKAGLSASSGQAVLFAQSQVANVWTLRSMIAEIATDSSRQVDYRIDLAPSGTGGAYIDVAGYLDRI